MKKERPIEEEIFSLETILSTITKRKNSSTNNSIVKKRLIFDQGPINGIAVKWVILFLLSLPVMLYAGIFNPSMFNMLGIAQAIIFFVVFLSMVMIIIVATIFINNSKVIRKITPTWAKSFPEIDLKLALASAGTPYKDFLKNYNKALEDGLTDKELEKRLQENFKQMENENQALVDAIKNDRSKR